MEFSYKPHFAMINILHFADFHFGVDNYGPMDPETRLNGRVLDFLDVLDSVIEYAEGHDAHLALFAGDLFHRYNPTATNNSLIVDRIHRLAEQCPLVLVPGNHDMPGSSDKASNLDVFRHVPGVIVGDKYDVWLVPTEAGAVSVATFPYPMKGRVPFEEETWDEDIRDKLEELADRVDGSTPAIFCGHFSVETARFGAERGIAFGDMAVSLVDVANPVYDYIALGHVHYHQNVTEGVQDIPPVVYSGSLERINFGEAEEAKGFCWISIDGEQVQWEFVEVDARPFRTVMVRGKRLTYKKLTNAIEEQDLTDAVVKVIIEVEYEEIPPSYIWEEIYKAGAYYLMSVQRVTKPVMRNRIEEDLTALLPIEQLEEYFIETEMDDEDIDDLLDLAEEIMNEVDRE